MNWWTIVILVVSLGLHYWRSRMSAELISLQGQAAAAARLIRSLSDRLVAAKASADPAALKAIAQQLEDAISFANGANPE